MLPSLSLGLVDAYNPVVLELQWVQGESWGLQGLAGVDPFSDGMCQPLRALDGTIARVATTLSLRPDPL
jgi:hypothetical protein